MNVLVCGASGCVGRAVVQALRARGHAVIAARRGAHDGVRDWAIDYMRPVAPADWARRLRSAQVDAVVNCVGILMPSRRQRFERVHAAGPIELFRGAALAGVRRIVQISALGVGDDAAALAMPYLHSKLRADDALAALPLQWAVLRPSLIYGPRSQSARLFATLASLPLITLPGRGAQQVQPLHVFELAEAVARLLEGELGWCRVHELGGPHALGYREMLAAYRSAQGLGAPLWLPLPRAGMAAVAALAEALPQQVFCRDTLRLLERGSVARINAAPLLLGRAPTPLRDGLAVTPIAPLLDLQVALSPALERLLRAALAFMWIHTALVSAWLPQQSGVLALLERCGFAGAAGLAALVFSCSLNLLLGVLTLARPAPALYALQAAAVLGYSATAAWNMPELTLDHCGPLVKNLPVLALVLLLWQGHRAAPPAGRERRMRHTGADVRRLVPR